MCILPHTHTHKVTFFKVFQLTPYKKSRTQEERNHAEEGRGQSQKGGSYRGSLLERVGAWKRRRLKGGTFPERVSEEASKSGAWEGRARGRAESGAVIEGRGGEERGGRGLNRESSCEEAKSGRGSGRGKSWKLLRNGISSEAEGTSDSRLPRLSAPRIRPLGPPHPPPRPLLTLSL